MLRTVFGLLKETASEWVDDKASSRGAALAYYSMFAIAPIVILAVSLAGLVYGEDAAQRQGGRANSGDRRQAARGGHRVDGPAAPATRRRPPWRPW